MRMELNVGGEVYGHQMLLSSRQAVVDMRIVSREWRDVEGLDCLLMISDFSFRSRHRRQAPVATWTIQIVRLIGPCASRWDPVTLPRRTY